MRIKARGFMPLLYCTRSKDANSMIGLKCLAKPQGQAKSALTSPGKPRSSHDTHQSSADFMAKAPYDFIIMLLAGETVPGEQQHEVIGYVKTFDVKPHAALGNIGHETVARQGAVGELDLRHAIERAPARAAALFGLEQGH
jgi:hypothetical protein